LKENATKRLSRQELYDLVWAEPMTTVASRYGISDVALKKKCAKAIIPTPDRGYWAKKEAGKPTIQLPLPKRAPGQDDEVIVSGGDRYWYGGHDESELLGALPSPPEFSEPIEEVRSRIAKTIGAVSVPRDVRIWAGPIERLFREDEKRREKQRNSPYPSSWDNPIFDSPFEQRRLRILNALSTATAKMHGQLYIHGKEGRSVGFRVVDQTVSIRLDIPAKRGREDSSVVWSPRPDHADMTLTIGEQESERQWSDDARGKIEAKLAEIAIEIIVSAEKRYRDRKVQSHKWMVERKAELGEAERKRKLEEEAAARERKRVLEEARVDRLLRDAAAFQQAREIRAYAEAIRELKLKDANAIPSGLDRWVTWAIAQADRIDPVIGNAFLVFMDDGDGEDAGSAPAATERNQILLLEHDLIRLEQENRALAGQFDALKRDATSHRYTYEDAVREQRHNYFKYRNARRY